MSATIAGRVASGAALLDEKLPGWDWDIDLSLLDLRSPCRCVLGQLHFSEDDPGQSYYAGLHGLGLTLTAEAGYGFNIAWPARELSAVAAEYDQLTTEWRRLILARREAVRP